MVRKGPAKPRPPARDAPPDPAEKARGGEIILRTRLRRAIFVGGLVGIIALLLVLRSATFD
ncbi:MAG TPA: hypothetical protein VFQ27_14810 [Xanthobacteraceae bacterium]|nr:hypothetical protein [Xanthobacteraceae bacterium]